MKKALKNSTGSMYNVTAVMLTIVAMFVSCRSVETTDNSNDNDSGLHLVSSMDSVAIRQIMLDPNLSDEEKEKLIREHFGADSVSISSTKTTTGPDPDSILNLYPDAKVIKIEDDGSRNALKDFLMVSPNPTSSDAKVIINRGNPPDLSGTNLDLDLYYEDRKINSLTLPVEIGNKIIISSNYLQREGTYTIVMSGSKISASFVVKK